MALQHYQSKEGIVPKEGLSEEDDDDQECPAEVSDEYHEQDRKKIIHYQEGQSAQQPQTLIKTNGRVKNASSFVNVQQRLALEEASYKSVQRDALEMSNNYSLEQQQMYGPTPKNIPVSNLDRSRQYDFLKQENYQSSLQNSSQKVQRQ